MINPWDLLPKWGRIALVGGVLLGSIIVLVIKIDNIRDDGVVQGANQERAITATKTLERVEISNETVEKVQKEITTGSGSLLYSECLRSARTPANCQRFLPSGQKAER